MVSVICFFFFVPTFDSGWCFHFSISSCYPEYGNRHRKDKDVNE